MKFSISNIDLFNNIFDICKQYSENIKIYISARGLHIQTSDDANIAIIDIKLNTSYFDTFVCEEEATIDFCLKDICKILKICKKSKSVTHFILNDNILKIIVLVDNIKKTFKVNSIYTNYDLIDINTININNSFTIDSKILKSVFDDFILFSNDITIKINNSDLYFYSNDCSTDIKYHYNTQSTNNTITNDICIESSFSLDYLHKFKLCSYFDINVIKLDNNTPIFLSIETNRDLEINFILAPKMT
jgi:hypothetical protein